VGGPAYGDFADEVVSRSQLALDDFGEELLVLPDRRFSPY
jgi:hypothetical protein